MIELLVSLVAFGLMAVPVGGLMLDRLLDVPARRYAAALGAPWLLAVAALAAFAQANGLAATSLLLWGLIGGALGTVALDAVRLIGVRRGAFPLDMPMMFGVLLEGLAPALQRNMIARMVELTAALPDDARRQAMVPRIRALAGLSEDRRAMVVAGMLAGLGRLTDQARQAMLQTQLALLAEAPAAERRAVMSTMDQVMRAPTAPPRYVQPRGMPRIPMATFRAMAAIELPRTLVDAGAPIARARSLGYVWHFLMGATLGAQYALLVGSGSWGLAVGWGVFVWLAMMVAMPPMMPMIRFPLWFPVVPLVAHVAFALPLAWVALAYIPAGTPAILLALGAALGR